MVVQPNFKATKGLRGWSLAKAGLAFTIALGSVMGISRPSLALSEGELYELCSKYPHNSQCEGYDIPVPLSRRNGEEGICAVNMPAASATDRCKVLLGEESLTIYLEEGEAIALMDDERRSQELTIGLDGIASLAYREDESANQDRMVANTLMFGVLGALFTQPDKISQVEVQFASEAAATTESPSSNSLVFETGREQGRSIGENLQQLTGIPLHTSP